MNTKLNTFPEPVQMSVGDALRLNVWAGVAVVVAFVSRLLLKKTPGLSDAAHVAVALLPLIPGLLYVRSLWRWIGSLDELQSRLQLEAVGFAGLAMLVVSLTLDLLRLAGVGSTLTFGWEGYFAFTFLLYAIGLARANRHYR